MKRFIVFILLFCATPFLVPAGILQGRIFMCDPHDSRSKNAPMPGIIVKVKWKGAIHAVESDMKGRYKIEFPDDVETLELSFSSGSLDIIIPETRTIKVHGRKKIRSDWDFCHRR